MESCADGVVLVVQWDLLLFLGGGLLLNSTIPAVAMDDDDVVVVAHLPWGDELWRQHSVAAAVVFGLGQSVVVVPCKRQHRGGRAN